MQGGGALIATPPHPAPAPARSGTPWAAVTTDHLQRLIPGVLGLHLAPGRPWQLPRHPKGGFFWGGHPQAAPGPLHTPAAQLRFCSRSPQKGALPWSLAKLRCSAPANTDLNRSGRYAGEVEPKVVGETLCPAKSDPKKAGQNNRPAPNLGDIASGCHLPAPLLAGGTTANRTSKGPTTAR